MVTASDELNAHRFGNDSRCVRLAQEHLDYAGVRLDDLAGFVLWLKNPYRSLKVLPVEPVTQARTNTTINQCMTAVAGFYDYLWRRDELTTDLTEQTRSYLPARTRSYKSFLHHITKRQLVEKNLLKQQVPRQQKPKKENSGFSMS